MAMSKKQDRIPSNRRKRQILIAEDELINREILGLMLQEHFEILFACDGGETLEMIRVHKDTLSLVLLDIMMPVMSGLEVLKIVKSEDELADLPVIVMTAEKEAEKESLELGAVDFIPKPYPDQGVILARLNRIIELFEDRDIIQVTERDALTDLYTKDYFYHYAQQMDQFHPDVEMDACILDINHFHMINERYGKAYGDETLQKIAEQLRLVIHDGSGILCRREADTFMIYGPHREDYNEILEHATDCLVDESHGENRIRLRMGIYPNVDREVEIEQRFDRAKMAADTVKGNFSRPIAYYDKQLHDQLLYAEQLIEAFPTAISENQFHVYYQPKFDIRPDTPILISAEALVRWMHPELGMISPGVFIPLFEENGLIQKLDAYVWRETARQIREWKDRLRYSVPVSVNVSRIDLFDPELTNLLQTILKDYRLTGQDFLLEVTESAYTQDAEQIIQTVERLRSMGFQVEMDDFGTGYSSLHMISTLPIDALKLDMQFIRDAFREGGNTHMLEVVIGISDYLSVPVIAEGVETEEQLHSLKMLGCDIVQGYFFSRPVPAEEFEAFILQKKEADLAALEHGARQEDPDQNEIDAETIMQKAKLNVLRQNQDLEAQKAEKAQDKENLLQSGEETKAIQLRATSIFFMVISLIAAAALLVIDLSVTAGYQNMEQASNRYISAQMRASDMERGSDYLTEQVRCFVATGEIKYLNYFTEEVEVTRTRDKALEDLEQLLGNTDRTALENLNTALTLSNDLVDVENLAMRLTLEAGEYDMEEIPEEISAIELSAEDLRLSAEELQKKAQQLVFGDSYMQSKDQIWEQIRLCTQSLILTSSQELEHASSQLSGLVRTQTIMTIVFLLIVLGLLSIVTFQVRKPLTNMVKLMQKQENIPPTGVEELQFVTRTYNQILQENKEAHERLSHEASHDALTGLFNRGAYDLWMEHADTQHIALILIDVDYFKTINDTYGHTIGDRVLQRVAEILRNSFRSVDILCRIGGDEFVVIMTRVDSSMRQLVQNKLNQANSILQHPKGDLPPISLSIGVAFSDRENPQGDIFKDADTALYRVKESGRSGCQIY